MDVKRAFPHAKLPDTDTVWIRLSKFDGIPTANDQIVRLVKSLYGLRQAPKLWYQHLAAALAKIGFRRAQSSDCVFIGGNKYSPVYILAYVDGLLIIGAPTVVTDTKSRLRTVLEIYDIVESS